jgi:DNA-binding CsgD family transcriptional regulator/PAS domain-containing protein
MRDIRDADLSAALHLIDAAYAAAVGETDWQAFLGTVNGVLGAGASLTVIDASAPAPTVLDWRVAGIDDGAIGSFVEHYAAVNPWQPAITRYGLGFAASDDLVPRAEFARTEFFNDWCRPWGIADSAGVVFANDGRRNATLTVVLPRLPEADRERTHGIVRLAVPHLMRAHAVHEALGRAAEAHGAVEAALAASGAACLVVEADGRIVSATAPAEAVLARDDGLLSAGGRLAAADADAARALARAIGETAAAARRRAEGGADAVPPAVRVPRRAGRGPYVVLTTPLPAAPRSPVRLPAADRVVVTIRDPDARRGADPARVAGALGLTPAEAALACALADGDTLQSHAAKRGVSVETVRTLLRSAFRRTGCHRQSELVALVLSGGA